VVTEDDFRDFVFTYPVEFWAGMNPDFFKGTAVEGCLRGTGVASRIAG
jgi:hypothetical protein